jgi:single-strand DNA-binding protein
MTTLRNSVQLIGNTGADPEVKSFGSDRKVARFSMATSESYLNDKGEKIEETQWHRLVAWGKVAERIEKSVKKGHYIAVTGKLATNNWEDKYGNKRQTVEVVINDFLDFSSFISSKES